MGREGGEKSGGAIAAGDSSGPAALTFRARAVVAWVFAGCVVVELAILLLDYHVNYGRLIDISPVRRLFNATREDALASWVAVTQTTFVALTAWLIFIVTCAQRRSRWVATAWLVIALGLTYMAFDDGSEFHERMGSTLEAIQKRQAAGQDAPAAEYRFLGVFPSYSWQVLFLPFFGALGIFMLVFLWRELGDRMGRALVLGGIACFVGAVAMDFVEGLDRGHRLNLWELIAAAPGIDGFTRERFDRDGYTAVRHFGKAVEEVVEMFGMTLFWVAFMRHAMRTAPQLLIRFV